MTPAPQPQSSFSTHPDALARRQQLNKVLEDTLKNYQLFEREARTFPSAPPSAPLSPCPPDTGHERPGGHHVRAPDASLG